VIVTPVVIVFRSSFHLPLLGKRSSCLPACLPFGGFSILGFLSLLGRAAIFQAEDSDNPAASSQQKIFDSWITNYSIITFDLKEIHYEAPYQAFESSKQQY
jgi:hypothetical protein